MKLRRLLIWSFIMLTVLAFVLSLMFSGSLAIWNLEEGTRNGVVIGYGCCVILAWMCIALESASKSK